MGLLIAGARATGTTGKDVLGGGTDLIFFSMLDADLPERPPRMARPSQSRS